MAHNEYTAEQCKRILLARVVAKHPELMDHQIDKVGTSVGTDAQNVPAPRGYVFVIMSHPNLGRVIVMVEGI
jgi:hypothetical protein